MLHLSSWTATLPILVIGMVGILLVMGVLVLAVMLLNKLTHRETAAPAGASCLAGAAVLHFHSFRAAARCLASLVVRIVVKPQ